MTAQFSDSVNYRGKKYSLAGINGGMLFDPTVHQIKPTGICSACWRGFLCSYAVEKNTLLLDSLSVLDLDEPMPLLFGKSPQLEESEYPIFHVIYAELGHPIPYTGGLLLANDFIEELYVHMGFHPAWKYREVHELIFQDGQLVEESDRSAQMAQFREELKDHPLEPGFHASETKIKNWIEKCFSQKYRW